MYRESGSLASKGYIYVSREHKAAHFFTRPRMSFEIVSCKDGIIK